MFFCWACWMLSICLFNQYFYEAYRILFSAHRIGATSAPVTSTPGVFVTAPNVGFQIIYTIENKGTSFHRVVFVEIFDAYW